MVKETEKASTDEVNNTRMTHFTVIGLPTRAICGAHLKGEVLSPTTPVDCIMCEWIAYGG